ncbi:hypothetical protein C2S51_022479 [Perilla frutescens var. frutescens]|nr:hypothetical protein C2S51_022479 [Perilla frutescens var. frutescens]
MYRQYSSRIQRNRGIKVKHALRICLLVAVCFWLIYQAKHSHEESDAEGFMHGGGSSGGLIKIRWKDLRALNQETVTENKQHNEATEEEETTEEVENNLEERSTGKKVEEEDEAVRDEHEVGKLDTQVDREEDNITDDAGVDGTEGEISDDGNGRKQENSVEDGSHAREEFYNADDASSAVTHDNHTQATENPGKEAYNGEMKKRLEVDGGEMSEDANPSSATDIETKENNLDSWLTVSPNDTLEASISTTDQGNTSTKGSNLKAIITLQLLNNSALDSNTTSDAASKNSESNFEDFSEASNDTLVRITRSDDSLQQKNETDDQVVESAITENRAY